MHEHPNQMDFTTLPPRMRQNPPVPAAKQPEFSPDEILRSPDKKNQDFLDSCVAAAAEGVDAARAALSSALRGRDMGLVDHATRAYVEAARLHLAAQRERRLLQTDWLQVELQQAEARGMLVDDAGLTMTALDFRAALDRLDDTARAAFSTPPPAHSRRSADMSEMPEMRGDLR